MPCTSLGTLVIEIDSWKTGPLSSALAVSFEVTKSSRAELDLFVGGAVSFVSISGSSFSLDLVERTPEFGQLHTGSV